MTAHVLRHSFATTLVRGKTDLVIAAELLGHARLETTRLYTQPTAEDRAKAIDLLARRRVADGGTDASHGLDDGYCRFGRILAVPFTQ